ncbi:MAG: 4-oxalocrotonate tautomerase [Thermoproteota archaeon]|nr:MAG: 4-oxalocrotonate tautomerase [Candidatus Korarchaeota archaeon]
MYFWFLRCTKGDVMPIVHVYVWKGLSNEAKKKVIEGITKTFVEIGIPEEAVEVVIQEVPKENWGVGGEQASEKFKHIEVP